MTDTEIDELWDEVLRLRNSVDLLVEERDKSMTEIFRLRAAITAALDSMEAHSEHLNLDRGEQTEWYQNLVGAMETASE